MQVRIYQPSKSTMQSGHARAKGWLIEPRLETKRQPEPIMGWTAAGDTFTELYGKLRFDSAEQAAAFAKDKGWSYSITPPNLRRNPVSNYLYNFKEKPNTAVATTPPGGKA